MTLPKTKFSKVTEKKSYSIIAEFLHDPSEFALASVTKPIYQQNHVFETLLCQVRIVKNCEKQLKGKDDKFYRL